MQVLDAAACNHALVVADIVPCGLVDEIQNFKA
jgi:hypothetical protein